MTNNSTLLYQVDEIRKLESVVIKKMGISVDDLMLKAGECAFSELKNNWPSVRNITVVCGKGNNAGDGYMVAYLAKKSRLNVKILQIVSDKELKGAAKRAYLKCKKLNIDIKKVNEKDLLKSDLIVDAILGNGLVGQVKAKFKAVIEHINNAGIPVLSLDVPSGICADTGEVLGAAIYADITVTFIGNKLGLFIGDAKDYSGKIIYKDLGFPKKIFEGGKSSVRLLDLMAEIQLLKPRWSNSHKGDFGHVLIVGGDYGTGGAVRIAGEAALRVGAGLATIATRPENVAPINSARPEIMVHGVIEERDLEPLLNKANVVVIGPGLGQSLWGKNLFDLAIKSNKPLLVDADGLNFLANSSRRNNNWILTPHPGEAARLLKTTSDKIQKDRLQSIQKLVKKFGGVIVLKGSGSLVGSQGERIGVCSLGNPGMSSAGMGDLLSGVIAGLVAQGLSLLEATELGVLVHAQAGDLVAAEYGERGILASDLLSVIRDLINV